jgi:hypothetical protein
LNTLVRHLLHPPGQPVIDLHRGDRVRDVLAVGVDVLDRRGAGPARDPGQALDAGQALRHAPGHQVIPVLPGRRRQQGRVAVGGELYSPGVGQHDQAGKSLVADYQVAAAAQDKDRLGRLVGAGHGRDQLVRRRRPDEAVRRAA